MEPLTATSEEPFVNINQFHYSFSKMCRKTFVSILCLFIFFSLQLERTAGKNYCYMRDDKPYRNFSLTTSYENGRDINMTVLPDCDISYIFAIVRHGTTYYGSSSIFTNSSIFKDQILENHEKYNRGQLCDEDLQNLRNWTFKWTAYVWGHLFPQGKADMYGIANRLKNKFGSYFSTFREKFAFATTRFARTQESAISFTNELFQTSFKDVVGNNIFIDDELLHLPTWNINHKPKEVEELDKSKLVLQMISEVTKRLGYESDLAFHQILNLYLLCNVENIGSINSKPAFCAAFTIEHLLIMEYWLDLFLYYQTGYGNNNTVGLLACPVIKNLFTKLMTAVKDPLYSEKGTFYFTHAETLLPLITQMKLFHDEIPLRYDNFESQKERKWRIADVVPYAANLMVILYKCKGELKIVFYKNEKMMKFHDCEEGICSVAKFEEIFTKKILKECSQNNSPRIEAINFYTIIVSICVILFSTKQSLN